MYKILKYIEAYQKEYNLAPMPILLCGSVIDSCASSCTWKSIMKNFLSGGLHFCLFQGLEWKQAGAGLQVSEVSGVCVIV